MIKANYIGWTATVFIIGATIIRAVDYSNFLDLILTFIGCSLWAVDGYKTKNTPLIFVNLFSVLILSIGLWRHL